MNTEDFVINNGSDSQVIKNLSKGSPHIERPILLDALIIEPIDLGDQPRLVVAPEEGDPVSVPDFEREEQEECFYAVPAPVDVVPEEYIVGVGRVSANFEEFEDVIKLAVDIAADGDGRPDSNSVGFIF